MMSRIVFILATVALIFSPSFEGKSVKHHHIVKRQATGGVDENCYKADVVVSLDSSGSIGQENWYKVLNFTRSLVAAFKIGPENIQVGANYYGNEATLQFHLNDYANKSDIMDAIDGMTWKDQMTNTSGGIRMMHRDMFTVANGMRNDAPHIGIVITDGESNRDENLTTIEADNARAKGIIMFAIGIGNSTSKAELEGIANKPSQDYVFEATNFDALPAITGAVVAAACKAASECSENGDWLLMVDTSGSVGPNNFEKIRGFLSELITDSNLDNQEARISLMTFSDTAKIEWGFGIHNTRDEMLLSLSRVKYRPGTTNTAGAFKMAQDEVFIASAGDRPDRSNTIVLFTDGNSNNLVSTLEEARLTRAKGIRILVVACTDWINMFELKEMASDPDDKNVITVLNYDAISTVYQSIKRAVCNDDSKCGNSPCLNGGTCVELLNNYRCDCVDGWAGKTCEIACPDSADVVIVLDSSDTMHEDGYYWTQSFAKELALALQVSPSGGRRVGLLTFSDAAEVRINLNVYSTSGALAEAISYKHTRGRTNMQLALDIIMARMFQTAVGDRSGARNFIIFLTSGNSNSRAQTMAAAAKAHQADCVILTATKQNPNFFFNMEMKGLTSAPVSKNYVQVENFDMLSNYTDFFVRSVCNTIDECNPNPCLGGSTCRNLINKYECVCPPGRTGVHCERTCDGEVDLVFIIDASGSIRENRFQLVLNFVNDIISQLDVSSDMARVAAIRFSDNANVEFMLDDYHTKEDVINRVGAMRYMRGMTHTADAIGKLSSDVLVAANGDRDTIPNIVIVVTDGHSNINANSTIPKAIEARVSGAHIIVVSVENNMNNLELRGIASKPWNKNLFAVNKFSDLPGFVDRLVMSFCDNVNECNSGPCQNGGSCFDTLNEYKCVCTNSFTGLNCERECTAQRDVIFALDASGSVDMFFAAQVLTERLISGLNFENSRTRVGVITYQLTPQVRFHLDKYTFKPEVINAISFDREMHIRGTNTADALKEIRLNMLTSANGDRNGYGNFVIVMSDGYSNVNEGQTMVEAQALKDDNVRVMAVGLGPRPNIAEITGMGETTADAFYMETEADVGTTASAVLDAMCQ